MSIHLEKLIGSTGVIAIRRPALGRAATSGLVASLAYLAAQAVDRRLVPNDYDDRLLWGGLVSRDPRWQRTLGFIGHCGVGVILATVYDAMGVSRAGRVRVHRGRGLTLRRRDRRRAGRGVTAAVLSGVAFTQLENLSLFPLVAVMGPLHPAVKRGDLPSLWTWRYFWLQLWRHVAYGAVLGLTARGGSGASRFQARTTRKSSGRRGAL